MMSFSEIVKIGNNKAVVLCRGVTDSGEKFFHFILSDKSNIQKMQRDFMDKKEVDFTNYGKIIYSGWGADPTDEDKAKVNQEVLLVSER